MPPDSSLNAGLGGGRALGGTGGASEISGSVSINNLSGTDDGESVKCRFL